MSNLRFLSAALAAASLLVCATSRAEEDQEHEASAAPERSPFRYDLSLRGAMNPTLASFEAGITYRHRLYASREPALADNGLAIRAAVGASLVGPRPSLGLQLQPTSFLRLSVVDVVAPPVLAVGGAFTSPNDNYSRPVFGNIPDGPSGKYSRFANTLLLGADLHFVLGRFIVRTAWRAERMDASLHDGDRVVYDGFLDTLIAAHGWGARGDSDLGWAFADGPVTQVVAAGARFTAVFVPYDSSLYNPGESPNTVNAPTAKVGPWVRLPLMKPKDQLLFPELNLSVLAQWYLLDRYHTGATTPAALPFIGLALTAAGDL